MAKRSKLHIFRVDVLKSMATARGITSNLLKPLVHKHMIGGVHPDNINYMRLWRLADEVSKTGLAAQISYLIDHLGYEDVVREILQISLLDSFIRRATSETGE